MVWQEHAFKVFGTSQWVHLTGCQAVAVSLGAANCLQVQMMGGTLKTKKAPIGTLKGVRPGQQRGSHVVGNVDTKQQNNAFSVLWSWQSKLFRGERVEVVCQDAIVPWHYPQISCLTIILFAPCLAGKPRLDCHAKPWQDLTPLEIVLDKEAWMDEIPEDDMSLP